ncbi:hypothetical protein Tco_1374803 [Tanacetum coccineum]
METIEELQTFIKVFSFAIFSISYCYFIPVRISNDIPSLRGRSRAFLCYMERVLLEVAVKKAVKGSFQLHWVVIGQITMVFVAVTCGSLLFPQLIRNGVDVKAIQEISLLVNFVRSKLE